MSEQAPEVAEDEGGLSTTEKWEVASIIVGIVFTLAYGAWLFSEMSEGQGDGPLYRLRWRMDQAKRRKAAEAEFQRDKNRMLFEAWEVMTRADA